MRLAECYEPALGWIEDILIVRFTRPRLHPVFYPGPLGYWIYEIIAYRCPYLPFLPTHTLSPHLPSPQNFSRNVMGPFYSFTPASSPSEDSTPAELVSATLWTPYHYLNSFCVQRSNYPIDWLPTQSIVKPTDGRDGFWVVKNGGIMTPTSPNLSPA